MMNFKFIKSGFVVVLWTAIIAFSTRAIAVMSLNDANHKHNLSTSRASGVKAVDNTDPRRTQICIFCHTPHNADNTQAPLWSHADQDASVTFQIASSEYVKPGRAGVTMDSQPTGISKKCLSCHDGTVAIGALANGSAIDVTGGGAGGGTQLGGTRTAPTWESTGDAGYIGTDLRGGHIISFKYDNTLVTDLNNYYEPDRFQNMPLADRPSMLDRNSKMHCHTCHDPHTDWCTEIDDATPGTVGRDPLWRKPCQTVNGKNNSNASVCVSCHVYDTFGNYTQGSPW